MPATKEATELVNDIAREINEFGRSNRRASAAAVEAHRAAVASTLASLLSTWLRPVQGALDGSPEGILEPSRRMSYQPMEKGNFTGQPTSFRTFSNLIGGLIDAGLVERHAALRQFLGPADGGDVWAKNWAARLWPSPRLLERAAAAGITPANVTQHFVVDPKRHPKTTAPVRLYPLNVRQGGQKVRGKTLPIPETPEFHRVASEVQAMNEFAANQTITTTQPCAPVAWFRQFNVDLGLHGRWYADGGADTYQSFPGAKRRDMISINGEPCAEVDISASHLSIIAAYLGKPLDHTKDPYSIRDIHRDIVKLFVVATIGRGEISSGKRWSRETLKQAGEWNIDLSKHKPEDVSAAVFGKYPILADLPGHFASLRGRYGVEPKRVVALFVMGLEAQIMTKAMLALKDLGILALPVHDSLVVPWRTTERAKAAITAAFREVLNAEPRIKIESPFGPQDAAWWT